MNYESVNQDGIKVELYETISTFSLSYLLLGCSDGVYRHADDIFHLCRSLKHFINGSKFRNDVDENSF